MSKSSKRKQKQEVEKAAKKLIEKAKQEPYLAKSPKTSAKKTSWISRLWTRCVHHPAKFVWWLVGAFVMVVSVIGSFPKVSVELGRTLNPKNMVDTKYVVQNDGLFKIYDVLVNMKWRDEPEDAYPSFYFISTNAVPFLKPGGKHSFNFRNFLRANPADSAHGALVQIDVVYRPLKFCTKTFTSSFMFRAQRGRDGEFGFDRFDDPDAKIIVDTNNMIWIDSLK